MDIKPRSAEEMRAMAEEYVTRMSEDLIRGHYRNLVEEAKRGQLSATIRFTNLYDAMSPVNERALNTLVELFPGCRFTYKEKECIRGEYTYRFQVSWATE